MFLLFVISFHICDKYISRLLEKSRAVLHSMSNCGLRGRIVPPGIILVIANEQRIAVVTSLGNDRSLGADAVKHLIQTKRQKRLLKKEEEKKAKKDV